MRLKIQPGWAAFGLLAAIFLMGSFPTTDKSKGSAHQLAYVTSTGMVIGAGGQIDRGPSFVSIGEVVAGSGVSLFRIGSQSVQNGAIEVDTLALGNGVSFDGFFKDGVDSLRCLTLGSGAQFSMTVSN